MTGASRITRPAVIWGLFSVCPPSDEGPRTTLTESNTHAYPGDPPFGAFYKHKRCGRRQCEVLHQGSLLHQGSFSLHLNCRSGHMLSAQTFLWTQSKAADTRAYTPGNWA